MSKIDVLEKELLEYYKKHPEVSVQEGIVSSAISNTVGNYTKPIKQAFNMMKNPAGAVTSDAINKAVKSVTPKKTKQQNITPSTSQTSTSQQSPSSLDSFASAANSQTFKNKNKAEQILNSVLDDLKALANLQAQPEQQETTGEAEK